MSQTFHAASVKSSERLQKAVRFVKSHRGWFTGWTLSANTGLLNPAGILSELHDPKNGFNFEKRKKDINGKLVTQWRLCK